MAEQAKKISQNIKELQDMIDEQDFELQTVLALSKSSAAENSSAKPMDTTTSAASVNSVSQTSEGIHKSVTSHPNFHNKSLEDIGFHHGMILQTSDLDQLPFLNTNASNSIPKWLCLPYIIKSSEIYACSYQLSIFYYLYCDKNKLSTQNASREEVTIIVGSHETHFKPNPSGLGFVICDDDDSFDITFDTLGELVDILTSGDRLEDLFEEVIKGFDEESNTYKDFDLVWFSDLIQDKKTLWQHIENKRQGSPSNGNGAKSIVTKPLDTTQLKINVDEANQSRRGEISMATSPDNAKSGSKNEVSKSNSEMHLQKVRTPEEMLQQMIKINKLLNFNSSHEIFTLAYTGNLIAVQRILGLQNHGDDVVADRNLLYSGPSHINLAMAAAAGGDYALPVLEYLLNLDPNLVDVVRNASGGNNIQTWDIFQWVGFGGSIKVHKAVIQILKHRNVPEELITKRKFRALLCAIEFNCITFIEDLINVDPELLHMKTDDGFTSLYASIYFKNETAFSKILAYDKALQNDKKMIHIIPANGVNILMLAIQNGLEKPVKEILQEKPEFIHSKDKTMNSVFHYAVRFMRHEILANLIEKAPEDFKQLNNNCELLNFALESKVSTKDMERMLRLLLEHNPNQILLADHKKRPFIKVFFERFFREQMGKLTGENVPLKAKNLYSIYARLIDIIKRGLDPNCNLNEEFNAYNKVMNQFQTAHKNLGEMIHQYETRTKGLHDTLDGRMKDCSVLEQQVKNLYEKLDSYYKFGKNEKVDKSKEPSAMSCDSFAGNKNNNGSNGIKFNSMLDQKPLQPLIEMKNDSEYEQLCQAIRTGNVRLLETLFKNGANILNVQGTRQSLIEFAQENNADIAILRLLNEQVHAAIKGKLYLGESKHQLQSKALLGDLYAIQNPNMTSLLKDWNTLAAADPTFCHNPWLTPLITAIIGGNLKVVDYLLENMPELVLPFKDNMNKYQALEKWDVMETAATAGNLPILERLMSFIYRSMNSEEAKYLYSKLSNCVFKAILNDQLPVLQYLFKIEPKLIYVRDNKGTTSLMCAINHNKSNIVDYLIQLQSTDNLLISLCDADGINAFMCAAEKNQVKILETLLQLKPDFLFQTDKKMRTALMLAVIEGAGDSIDYLIAMNTKAKSCGNSKQDLLTMISRGGLTALEVAAKSGNIDIVKRLLKSHVSRGFFELNTKSDYNILHWAIAKGHILLVRYLMEEFPHAADLICQTRSGLGIAQIAITHEQVEILSYLYERYPALVFCPGTNGITSTIAAMSLSDQEGESSFKIVDLLLKINPLEMLNSDLKAKLFMEHGNHTQDNHIKSMEKFIFDALLQLLNNLASKNQNINKLLGYKKELSALIEMQQGLQQKLQAVSSECMVLSQQLNELSIENNVLLKKKDELEHHMPKSGNAAQSNIPNVVFEMALPLSNTNTNGDTQRKRPLSPLQFSESTSNGSDNNSSNHKDKRMRLS